MATFSGPRTAFRIDKTPGGLDVVDAAGNKTPVAFGETLRFDDPDSDHADVVKLAKDVTYLAANIDSHIEFHDVDDRPAFQDLPFDLIRTGGPSYELYDQPIEDAAGKLIVGYVNLLEYRHSGTWDIAFDAAWDKDGDGLIDASFPTGQLPAYAQDRKLKSAADTDHAYVARFWDGSWFEMLKAKVDAVASQGFDGVMLDAMTSYYVWVADGFGGDWRAAQEAVETLIERVSDYAKETFGTSFLVCVNLDREAMNYFHDIETSVDIAYYQSALWDWSGSGEPLHNDDLIGKPEIDFLSNHGLTPLLMEHLDVHAGPAFAAQLAELMTLWETRGLLPYLTVHDQQTIPSCWAPRFANIRPDGTATGSGWMDWIRGDDRPNQISGETADDALYGLAGDDRLEGGAGSDVLQGGAGFDTAISRSTSSAYEWWETGDGSWRLKDLRAGSSDGTDILVDIERLQFSDRVVKILGLTNAEKLAAAYENVLRVSTPTSAEATFLNGLVTAVSGSTKTLAAAIGEIVGKADQTTAVAAMSYQFFLNFVPSKDGFDYLVSPQGPNPNNINSAYYQSFNIENRYINFAVNLGKVGEGAPSFLAEYGAKTLFQATKDAYMEIFGGTVVDSKINTILDSSVGAMSRAQYFALYGGDGLTGIGTKAAMVGWLLTEAAKADLGMYANSSNAFLTDLADGAQTLVDVVGVYGQPGYIFNG